MGRIRIIGGKWRNRPLSVLQAPELRPTPSRVRETLFNWLAPTIVGARCLDCFAGTGILGFEALSRGAGFVLMLEQSKRLIATLKKTAETFEVSTQSLQFKQVDTVKWLSQTQQIEPFDIIFLDPPFEKELWHQTLNNLLQSGFCHDSTQLYVESSVKPEQFVVKAPWKEVKHKKAGNVKYQLIGWDKSLGISKLSTTRP